MSKATLEFTLPEEQYEFKQAAHAGEAWAVIHDLDCEMRNFLKHGDGRFSSPEELARYIREQLNEVSMTLD
jgi:hypothetical protein